MPFPRWDKNLTDEQNRANGILLVTLKKNQSLFLRCDARKGIGRVHAKSRTSNCRRKLQPYAKTWRPDGIWSCTDVQSQQCNMN